MIRRGMWLRKIGKTTVEGWSLREVLARSPDRLAGSGEEGPRAGVHHGGEEGLEQTRQRRVDRLMVHGAGNVFSSPDGGTKCICVVLLAR